LNLPADVKKYTGVIGAGAVLGGGVAALVLCTVTKPPRFGLDPFGLIDEYSTPLRLKDDWRQFGGMVHGIAYVTNARAAARRQPVSVAGRPEGALEEALRASSQAEVFGLHAPKYEDLMHQDWRARLSLSSAEQIGVEMANEFKWYWVH
jgi:hypothetical protein